MIHCWRCIISLGCDPFVIIHHQTSGLKALRGRCKYQLRCMLPTCDCKSRACAMIFQSISIGSRTNNNVDTRQNQHCKLSVTHVYHVHGCHVVNCTSGWSFEVAPLQKPKSQDFPDGFDYSFHRTYKGATIQDRILVASFTDAQQQKNRV